MADRDHHSRRRVKANAPSLPQEAAQARPMHDQEAVDGILVNIHKRELTIADEQSDQTQKHSGYEIRVVLPEWDKNRDLLKSVKKGYMAQQKLLAKLQREGAQRSWMIQQFIAIDKAVATSLGTVAERIRTRRWRERERGSALQRLQATFGNLQRWTAKATRYCERAHECPDPTEKEILLDAACFSIFKVGELVNKVERMQHGFWEDFSSAHFLKLRRIRNLIGHTDNLEGEAAIPIGTGICQDLQFALERTLFPEKAGFSEGEFLMSGSQLLELEPSRPGDKITSSNSIAMIGIDDRSRFCIYRIALGDGNRELLLSSSATGQKKVSFYRLIPHPETIPQDETDDRA